MALNQDTCNKYIRQNHKLHVQELSYDTITETATQLNYPPIFLTFMLTMPAITLDGDVWHARSTKS